MIFLVLDWKRHDICWEQALFPTLCEWQAWSLTLLQVALFQTLGCSSRDTLMSSLLNTRRGPSADLLQLTTLLPALSTLEAFASLVSQLHVLNSERPAGSPWVLPTCGMTWKLYLDLKLEQLKGSPNFFLIS